MTFVGLSLRTLLSLPYGYPPCTETVFHLINFDVVVIQLDYNREPRDEEQRAKREEELNEIMTQQISSGQFREVCWDLAQRGSVGETWFRFNKIIRTCIFSFLHLTTMERP